MIDLMTLIKDFFSAYLTILFQWQMVLAAVVFGVGSFIVFGALSSSRLAEGAFIVLNNAITLGSVSVLIATLGPNMLDISLEQVTWSTSRTLSFLALGVPIRIIFNGGSLFRSVLVGSFLQGMIQLGTIAAFAGLDEEAWLPNALIVILIIGQGLAYNWLIERRMYKLADRGEIRNPVLGLILFSGVMLLIPLAVFAAYIRVVVLHS